MSLCGTLLLKKFCVVEKDVELICEILDIDYEELKDKLPEQPDKELNDANALLDGVVDE